jgi:hypothetical protein
MLGLSLFVVLNAGGNHTVQTKSDELIVMRNNYEMINKLHGVEMHKESLSKIKSMRSKA